MSNYDNSPVVKGFNFTIYKASNAWFLWNILSVKFGQESCTLKNLCKSNLFI